MSGHSPGPWKIKKHIVNRSLVSAEGEYILEGFGALPTEANLRLIAAAPDLLEVVRDFRQKLVTYTKVYLGDKELRRQLDDCDAAIAKAEGRE